MVYTTYVTPFVANIRRICPTFAQKCLGFVEGNHHGKLMSQRFQNGTTTTQEICRLLGIRYLGLSSWMRVTAYRSVGKKKLGTGHNLNILANHGGATGNTLGGSLNAAIRKLGGFRGVDVMLTAHDHQLGHDTIQQLGVQQRGKPMMMQYETVIGKVGSFQKGYVDGAQSDSYVERKLFKPSRLGWLSFDANIYRPHSDGDTTEVWRYSNFSA